MDEKYCQSCGMPMGATNEMYGTNTDGNKSTDYCSYCFENGAFVTNCSMEEMIELCVPHMVSSTGFKEDKARNIMCKFLPTLKRWKTVN